MISDASVVKTVLVVLTEKYDDMMFLGSQVILEERGVDVIVSSVRNGTAKGQDSSVMTVSLEEAINNNDNYDGIILIEGSDLTNWVYLRNILGMFISKQKIIGFSRSSRQLLAHLNLNIDFNTQEIIISNNLIYLGDVSKSEKFVENYSEILLRN